MTTLGSCGTGQNEYGELGDGTVVNRSTPVPVVNSNSYNQVAAGWYHSLGLHSNGTVWAWGRNAYGELGDGTTTDSPTPQPVTGLTGVTAVAAGEWHSLALKSDGTVWAWGYNGYGELGDGTTTNRITPVQVINLTGVVAIASGALHSLALKSDGTVWDWGYNGYGQLGDGTTTETNSPVQVALLSGVTHIAAGADHSLALKSDGTVQGWGYNGDGELGDGSTTNRVNIVRASGLTSVAEIAGGDYHSVVILTNGTVWAWGYNRYGQLGDGTTTERVTPVQVPGFSLGAAVAGATANTVVLKSDGTIWTWGDNSYGQLGNGTTTGSLTPLEASPCPSGSYVNTPMSPFSARLSAAQGYSMAVENNGNVEAWGQNSYGQLGDGTVVDTSSPQPYAGPTTNKAVAAGWYHSLALDTNGTVWAAGRNNYGELGDGTTTDSPTPQQVTGLTNIIAIAAGEWHSLALKSDGTVWAWGYNGYGELGDGTTTNRITPVQVSNLTGVVAIASGALHSLALKSDGTVWDWGYNGYGQLGDGTTTERNSPVQVALLSGVINIAAGADHSLALKSDGTIQAWGYNDDGELGDGSSSYRVNIVRVSGITSAVAIAGGDYHSLAVLSDGTVRAWGYNRYGQLGDGTTTERLTPVQATGITNALAVAAGTAHSLALKSDGTISAWGSNTYGQFGEASPTSSDSPVTTPVTGVGPFYLLTLSASPSGDGSVTASPTSPDGYYQTGTQVCLSATPASGYVFSDFSGASVNSSGCLTLTANGSVVANFVPAPALRFIPVTPCRLADTRNASGPFGGPELAAGGIRSFTVPNNTTCNIPTTAQAYSLNVTVVPSGPLQYLTVWPAGEQQPVVSTLNSPDGRIKANAAIIPAGSNGAVSVYATNATNVILDIDGYFVPATNTSALAFYPVTPCRIADTRSGSGPFGPPSLIAKQDRTFPILSSSCDLPATAKAYSLNFTAIPKTTLAYLTVWPTGQGQPNVSTLNAPTGTVTANAAIVPSGSSGSIDVYASDATDLIIDVNGYFAAPVSGALSLYNLTPCRVLDTRNPPGSQPFSGTKTVNASASACNVPTSSQALVFNATVVPPGALTYLTLWSTGQAQPTVSTLNAEDGAITSNLAIVPDSSGSINAFASNPTQLILDISGYFAP